MSIFTKMYHHIIKKEEELFAVNNAKRIYSAWKRWRSQSETPGERPLKIARSPDGRDFPTKIAQTPVTPLSEMKIARAPGNVEVLPPATEVLPRQATLVTQNPAPVHMIDVEPVKQVHLTKESADQGKHFF